MDDLRKNLASWREANPDSSEDESVKYLNQELLVLYPELIFRWSKIYGSRWAYLCGNSSEMAANPVKIPLNRDYGICIDNPDILSNGELDRLIFNLKESLTNVTNC